MSDKGNKAVTKTDTEKDIQDKDIIQNDSETKIFKMQLYKQNKLELLRKSIVTKPEPGRKGSLSHMDKVLVKI